jgi:hypothetical protein
MHPLGTCMQMCSNPELVDDTYILANRALSYRPQLLVHTLLAPDAAASIAAAGGAGPAAGALPVLLDCAAAGLLLQHREANLSVLSFLVGYNNAAQDSESGHMQSSVASAGWSAPFLEVGLILCLPLPRLCRLACCPLLCARMRRGLMPPCRHCWAHVRRS